jgi:hypothetical protein
MKGYKSHSNSKAASSSRKRERKSTLGGLVKNEIEYRKKESLGLLATPKGVDRTLGAVPKARNGESALESNTLGPSSSNMWSCLVCTL